MSDQQFKENPDDQETDHNQNDITNSIQDQQTSKQDYFLMTAGKIDVDSKAVSDLREVSTI